MRKKDVLPRSLSTGSTAIARDFGQIFAAVAAGVLVGLIWSFYSPRGLLSRSHGSVSLEVHDLGDCDIMDKYSSLREDIKVAQQENIKLKSRLKHWQQEIKAAQQQLLAFQQPLKAGPLGTVKSLRTYSMIRPDKVVNAELDQLLKRIAIDREVIVGIANNNVREMVQVWFASLKNVGVTNAFLVALDDDIAKFCRSNSIAFYRRDATVSRAQKETGDNHAISGLKFDILREFLVLGYNVLLSDVDVVFFQNPFLHLNRDCDVEAMTDGADNQTAYGYDDVSDDVKMGWSRYAHTMRIWVFNSGFFYIRPTISSIDLIDRVTSRLRKEKAWDQAVFNEELFFPSHPGFKGLHASKRVMDYYLFMNSKVMFTRVRNDPNLEKLVPVAVHVNYHPNKFERMLALLEYYVNGKKDALQRFPDGSE